MDNQDIIALSEYRLEQIETTKIMVERAEKYIKSKLKK